QVSCDTYDRTFRMFLGYVTQIAARKDEPASFSEDTVRAWVLHEGDRLKDRPGRARTITARLHQLSTLGRYMATELRAKRNRPVLAENPVAHVTRPKFGKPETKILHPDEMASFLRAVADRPPHDVVACEVLLDTMLRVSEVCSANVGDLAGPNGAGEYTL